MSVACTQALPKASSAWNFSSSTEINDVAGLGGLCDAAAALPRDVIGKRSSAHTHTHTHSNSNSNSHARAFNARARCEARRRAGLDNPNKFLIVQPSNNNNNNSNSNSKDDSSLSAEKNVSNTHTHTNAAIDAEPVTASVLLDFSSPLPAPSSSSQQQQQQAFSFSTAGSNAFLIDLFAPVAAPPSFPASFPPLNNNDQTNATASLSSVGTSLPTQPQRTSQAAEPSSGGSSDGILDLFKDFSPSAPSASVSSSASSSVQREMEQCELVLAVREKLLCSAKGSTTVRLDLQGALSLRLSLPPSSLPAAEEKRERDFDLSLALSFPNNNNNNNHTIFSVSPSLSTKASDNNKHELSLTRQQVVSSPGLALGTYTLAQNPRPELFVVLSKVQLSPTQPSLARVLVRVSLSPSLALVLNNNNNTTNIARIKNLRVQVALSSLAAKTPLSVTGLKPSNNAQAQGEHLLSWQCGDVDFRKIANKLDLEVHLRLGGEPSEQTLKELATLRVPVSVRGLCEGLLVSSSAAGSEELQANATLSAAGSTVVNKAVKIVKSTDFDCRFQ